MTLPEEYGRCLACGAVCDGSVCDLSCEMEMDRRSEAKRTAELEEKGLLECGYCGGTYKDTPRTKPICDACLKDAGF